MAAREIDPRAPEPPYRQIAADLIAEIERGDLAPGRPLPSEKELTERYGVARNTARSALALLRDRGLIFTVSGRGSYVTDRSDSDGQGDT
ncbi:GntR family transcriptional regulator [Streptomyces clavuligerus]|uniref:Transcriptional regulator n=1 Tax=Streptomyces clavuligerus TaxID=1901 RepID=E2Q137_STRCL|nr:GntR family transcriptional regulator [Streptomyces clavuligerus]EFG08542.1 Transcriptional regulator [Streptomyces clavuligerus]MBY6303300.1 GntR family transcriptional regulator [Streptomyces clavuligerus]QPL63414.1 GntR family transcriptional regulator [Streptomyces clavuligerus]QPL69440.1 GntR family transcriptional regulator [Streptomyces clavuligerus]QPL75523.1 GntR family transcriptional regulator [Streptomyces clavuligerus]